MMGSNPGTAGLLGGKAVLFAHAKRCQQVADNRRWVGDILFWMN